MRSDRDKRTDSEREIDDFLSKFDDPADEMSADYSSYLDESNTSKPTSAQTFYWKDVDSPDLAKVQSEDKSSDSSKNEKGSENPPEKEGSASDAEKNEEKAADADKKPAKKKKRSKKKKKEEAAAVVPAAAEVSSEADVKEESKEEPADDSAKGADDKPDTKKESSKESGENKDKKKSPDNKDKKDNKKDKKKKQFKKSADKTALKHRLFYKKNKDYDPAKGATYVKDGKTIKNREYRFSFAKLVRDVVALGLIFVAAGLIYFLSIIAVAPKYDYKDIYSAIETSSVVYDDQGKQIDNIFYTENRKVVKYEDMPEDLINSFIAIEDKTFWKHHGFNWTRMFGAILSSFTGNGRISGTSTITQQLARNVYLADTKSVRSVKRKLLEMYYASRIEHSLSKEEIIEAYLNTIYLGHGCYGVYAAANTYFSKPVKKLDLVECASLAALPQSPDTYALLKLASEAQDAVDSKVVATDPNTVVTNDISRDRRQLTLDLMLAQNYIDQSEHDEAYDKTLNDFIDPNLSSNSSIYSYFHEYLVDTIINDLIDKYGMSYEDAERMVYTKGLQIYSTVDSTATQVIADEFQDGSNFPYVSAPKDADGNLLNNDGKISLYNYSNDFDDDGDFKLSGEDGDVKVNDDGSVTIMKDHKLFIYETEVDGSTDYSLEFKPYYVYDDEDILYSISGGYFNVPAAYKSSDGSGNVVIDKEFFNDPLYADTVKISGNDLVVTDRAYTLNPKQRQPQAAMTIVGVGTGEVKAMVGGRQFGGQKVLNRSLNPRQPGSSIKPLAVYGAALQKSYELEKQGKKWTYTNFGIDKQGTKGWGDYVTVHSSIQDEKTRVNGKDWPKNASGGFSGKNTFRTAVQRSINTCAVKLQLQVGADYSIEQLKKFNLTTVHDDTSEQVNDVNPAALALGAMTEGVEPLEMALAYAAFPAGGKVNTPVCYYKVLDRNGEVLLESKSEQSEALNEGVAWIMTDVLKSVVRANGYMSVSDTVPGGKTGTTNDQYDIWFDGFTPSYAAALWVGTDENVEMSTMSVPAAALWGRIINQIPGAKVGEYAPMPSNVIQYGGEYYTKGTEKGLSSYKSPEEEKKEKEEEEKKKAEEEARKLAEEQAKLEAELEKQREEEKKRQQQNSSSGSSSSGGSSSGGGGNSGGGSGSGGETPVTPPPDTPTPEDPVVDPTDPTNPTDPSTGSGV